MNHFFLWGFGSAFSISFLLHIIRVRMIHLEYEDRSKSALVTINNRINEAYQLGAKEMSKQMIERLKMVKKQAEDAKLYTVATAYTLYPEHARANKLSVGGAKWDKEEAINIYLDHDFTKPSIGVARLIISEGCIKSAFHFFNESDRELYKMLYPSLAISFDREKDVIEENGVDVYTSFNIFAVSLCNQPNIDPYVKRLFEQ